MSKWGYCPMSFYTCGRPIWGRAQGPLLQMIRRW
jgi:hypothetical protein